MERELEERLAAALDREQTKPEWDDVIVRAGVGQSQPEQSRVRTVFRRHPRLLLAACAAVGILIAAPAFGGTPGFLPFFGSDKAPSAVVQEFSALDVGAPAGMATGVISDETRGVRLSAGGRQYTMWVAPTEAGGFCRLLEGGGGGCDRNRELPLSVGLGKASPSAPLLLGGSVLRDNVASIEIRYEDGGADGIPITWVSKPIDAAFFATEISSTHYAAGRRPITVVALDANGNEVLRNELPRGLPWEMWNNANTSAK